MRLRVAVFACLVTLGGCASSPAKNACALLDAEALAKISDEVAHAREKAQGLVALVKAALR